MTRRVFITGIRAITPLGAGLSSLRSGLAEGRSAIGPIRSFDVSRLTTRIRGELTEIDLAARFDERDLGWLSRLSALAILAGEEAVENAGGGLDGERTGVFFGTGFGTLPEAERHYLRWMAEGDTVARPNTIPSLKLNAPSAQLGIRLGLRGPNLTLSTACAAGEWIEIHNPNLRAVSLLGWRLTDGASESHTIQGDLWLPPLGYAVLARSDDPAANGGVAAAYRYGGVNLANGGDLLILVNADGAEVARVEWGGASGLSAPSGASLERIAAPGGPTWQVAPAAWPGSAGDRGSPGQPNLPAARPTATATPSPTATATETPAAAESPTGFVTPTLAASATPISTAETPAATPTVDPTVEPTAEAPATALVLITPTPRPQPTPTATVVLLPLVISEVMADPAAVSDWGRPFREGCCRET